MLFAFALHSWYQGNVEHLPALGLFWCHISDGRGDRCGLHHTAQRLAQHHNIASAGSGYLGQTQGLSGIGVHRGSSQTSVLVKVSNQRAGEQNAEPSPKALWEKSSLPLTSLRPARVDGGPLTSYCVTDEQSAALCP